MQNSKVKVVAQRLQDSVQLLFKAPIHEICTFLSTLPDDSAVLLETLKLPSKSMPYFNYGVLLSVQNDNNLKLSKNADLKTELQNIVLELQQEFPAISTSGSKTLPRVVSKSTDNDLGRS
jgi:hypothetical protein